MFCWLHAQQRVDDLVPERSVSDPLYGEDVPRGNLEPAVSQQVPDKFVGEHLGSIRSQRDRRLLLRRQKLRIDLLGRGGGDVVFDGWQVRIEHARAGDVDRRHRPSVSAAGRYNRQLAVTSPILKPVRGPRHGQAATRALVSCPYRESPGAARRTQRAVQTLSALLAGLGANAGSPARLTLRRAQPSAFSLAQSTS